MPMSSADDDVCHRQAQAATGDDVCHRRGGDIGIYRSPPPPARLGRRRRGRTRTMSATLSGELRKTRFYGCCAGTIAIRAPTAADRWLAADGGQAERTRADRRLDPARRRRRCGLQRRASPTGARPHRRRMDSQPGPRHAGAGGHRVLSAPVRPARLVRGGHATLALVATACYLPLYVRHVWYAARGSRPAGAGWTLLAMTVVILGALPLIG